MPRRPISLAGAALLLASPAPAQTYSITPIDPHAASLASFATSINAAGTVTGLVSIEGGRRTLGFLWRDGALVQLVVPQPGDFSVRPRTLDIQHHVAVFASTVGGYYAGTGNNVDFGFSSQPYFAWLPHPDPYPPQYVAADDLGDTLVWGIADTSPFITAVGVGTPGGNLRQGFIAHLSQADDVGDPPRMTLLPAHSAAYGVNSAGDAVGYMTGPSGARRPFLRPAATGALIDLGTLGGPSGEARAISDAGYVVGQADVAPGRPHAFMMAPGVPGLIDLGALGGGVSVGRAVNNQGAAVGETWAADGTARAFLWQSGLLVDLNSQVPPASGWHLTQASGINDAGEIVGWGVQAGRTVAFLLRPQAACYPNCDASTQPPILNVQDFSCFLTRYAAGDPYANCDASTQPPVLNVQDFSCFLTRYAAGCS